MRLQVPGAGGGSRAEDRAVTATTGARRRPGRWACRQRPCRAARRRAGSSLRSAPRRDPGRLRQRGGLRCAPLRGAGGVRKRPRPPPQPGIPRFVSDTPGSATRVRDSAAAGGERPGSAVSSRHLPRPPSLPPSRCFAPVLAKGKEVAPRRAVPCRTLPGCAAPSAQPPPFLCPALPCPARFQVPAARGPQPPRATPARRAELRSLTACRSRRVCPQGAVSRLRLARLRRKAQLVPALRL